MTTPIRHLRLYERETGHLRNKFEQENSAVFAEPYFKRGPVYQRLVEHGQRAITAWYAYDPTVLLDLVEETVDSRGRVKRKVL